MQARQSAGGFSTAKAVLAAEAQRGGKAGFNAREYSSGSMFPDAAAAFPNGRGRGARPVASGLRKNQAPKETGPRGAFVPPFVKKAMAVQNGETEEGPLSSKTLDALAGVVRCAPPILPLPQTLRGPFELKLVWCIGGQQER